MDYKRASLVTELEYVGTLVETEDTPFRPSGNVDASELNLRGVHRKSTKKHPRVTPIGGSVSAPASKKTLVSSGKSGAVPISTSTSQPVFSIYSKNFRQELMTAPVTSAEFLRAEEIKMEILNRQREIEFNIAKKLMDRLKPAFYPDKIEFMPEQSQKIEDDECRNLVRDPYSVHYRDSADVSYDPSYSKFELPYNLICLNRYKAMKSKYEMQLRHELEMLQDMQPSAYEAARFARFLGPLALQKTNYSPRTVKFTPKQRKRIQHLLQEEQR